MYTEDVKMDVEPFELPTLLGDTTFQKKCIVILDTVPSGVTMVSFYDENGSDVLWHDSRVRRYLRQNRHIAHYRAGAQWLDDVSLAEKYQLEKSRQALVDLCISPAYKHIVALSWTPWEHHAWDTIAFVLYTACSAQSNIDVVSTEFINRSHNYEQVRRCAERLHMERYLDRQFVDGKLESAHYEVYIGSNTLMSGGEKYPGHAAKVIRRHQQPIVYDTGEVPKYYYAGETID